MKLNTKIKDLIVVVICLLYIMLFVYTAVSKMLDFERFQVQLAQSPLLSAFASWISWIVIGVELIIALLLMFRKSRIIGLYTALSLMTMFTVYVFIILNYSSFIPCSCGGILEKMTWNVHLIFNIVFMLFALIALIIEIKNYRNKIGLKRSVLYLRIIPFSIFASILLVVLLYLSSEDIMHHKNPFIRVYPPNPTQQVRKIDLKFNSYYFAGTVNDVIYLGNYTDPLHLLSIDSLGHQKKINLDFYRKDLPLRAIKIVVRKNYVYLMDGTVPCVFRGKISDFKIITQLKGVPRFTLAQPIDSSTIVFRNNTGTNRANVLGIFYGEKESSIHYFPHFLQQQIDGIFDTDGILQYNEEMKFIVYNYFYRNQFMVIDQSGDLQFTGHTIDTITHAKIKVAYLKNNTERQMGAPPFIVNSITATKNHLLFVNSKVPGRFENNLLWKYASIIDVYDLKKNRYVLSFAIYGRKNKKAKNLLVTNNHLYVLLGSDLVIYKLRGLLKKEMKNGLGNLPDA